MKYVFVVLAILFALFAYFQLNDPDPYLWVGLYVALALLAGLAATGRFYLPIIIGGMVLCGVGALLTIPSLLEFMTNDDGMTLKEGMSYEYPYIEESREFGGLLIGFLTLLFFFFQARKARQASQDN
ncbi:MAG: transmembrane 220 family protein [Bacteroidota bacterium]